MMKKKERKSLMKHEAKIELVEKVKQQQNGKVLLSSFLFHFFLSCESFLFLFFIYKHSAHILMCVSPFFIHEIRDLTNFVDRLHKIMQRKFRYAMYCVHRMIASVSYLSQYLSFLLFLSLPTLFLSVCIYFFLS